MSSIVELKDVQSVRYEKDLALLNAKRYISADGHTCYEGECYCCCYGCRMENSTEDEWGDDVFFLTCSYYGWGV